MASEEKNIRSLIKKIQKKCEVKAATREARQDKKIDVTVEEYKEATDIFREMKKLPFSE